MRIRPSIGLVAALLVLVPQAEARPAPDTTTIPPVISPWQAVAASGSVQARPAMAGQAAWSDVSSGDELMPSSLVQTGHDGRVTLTHHASRMILDPDSRLALPDEGRRPMETSVMQTEGSVLYEVDRRSNPHFEVVTPYLVAGVGGTSFLITVNDRYASVTVRDGLVEIINPGTGETLLLYPGESVVRRRGEAEMDVVADRESREARKEHKLLQRLERRSRDQERERQRDREADDLLDAALDIERITNELIEEMIRQEILRR